MTLPATAISHGDLGAAARQTLVPNPPGYPLLTAPFVIALRPWIGSPRWCDDKPIPTLLQHVGETYFRSILGPCTARHGNDHGKPYPIWYRSQALLAILAWVVLAAGAAVFMRSIGAGGRVAEVLVVAAMAAVPAASDAIAQTFHPQDLVSVGLVCGGVAQALRRRWVLVGVAFGVAFLCKQFAVLPLLGVLAAAPRWRDRARVVVPAGAIVAAGVVPFYVAAPVATVRAMTAVYVAGVTLVKTPTVVGVLSIGEQSKLEIARDAPIVAAALLVVWARRRAGSRLLAPAPLVGLSLACLAARLVFEISLLNYYFLAVAVALVLLDLTCRRVPVWSVLWIVATRDALTPSAPHAPLVLTAVLFLVAALVPIGLGLAQVVAVPRRHEGGQGSAPVFSGTASTAWPSGPGSSGWHRAGGCRRWGRTGGLGPVFDLDDSLARCGPSVVGVTLVVLRALLVDGEVEGPLELPQLIEVVLQPHRQPVRVCDGGQVLVEGELLGRREGEPRLVLVSVDVVEVDGVEPRRLALRHPGGDDRQQDARGPDVEPALSGPTVGEALDRGRIRPGVGTEALPGSGVDVAHGVGPDGVDGANGGGVEGAAVGGVEVDVVDVGTRTQAPPLMGTTHRLVLSFPCNWYCHRQRLSWESTCSWPPAVGAITVSDEAARRRERQAATAALAARPTSTTPSRRRAYAPGRQVRAGVARLLTGHRARRPRRLPLRCGAVCSWLGALTVPGSGVTWR